MHTTKTRGADRVLEDDILQSPVDKALRRKWKHTLWILLVIIVAVVGARIVRHFLIDRPATYLSDEEHFLYGSIGVEPSGSLFHAVGGMLPPYYVFAWTADTFARSIFLSDYSVIR